MLTSSSLLLWRLPSICVTLKETNMKNVKPFVLVLGLAFSPLIFSQSTDSGPTIEGATNMQIEAAGVLNAGVGDGSTASMAIGAIDSGSIKGETDIAVSAEGALNAGVGKDSCADMAIGTIGHKSSCK